MALHVERRGEGPTLVLVHGFTQTGRSWGALADALAANHEVVLPDAPGHAASSDVRADLVAGAHLLVDAVAGPATFVGYSMGARFCLHAALEHPAVVRGLVMVGGTAGLDDPVERAARVEQDRATAVRIEADGLGRFLDDWVAQPLFAGLSRQQAGLEERRRNSVAGLASSLELAGAGAQEPLWDRLPQLTMPVLAVAGADDAKFAGLAERMVAAIGPSATLALVTGAGHAAHLEQPDAFLRLLQGWLSAHDL
jgi:2-succinyl-6-hydroxy-2,4-cyclohexadiene-1-carboxylate synthase